jgi:hypothetical protein
MTSIRSGIRMTGGIAAQGDHMSHDEEEDDLDLVIEGGERRKSSVGEGRAPISRGLGVEFGRTCKIWVYEVDFLMSL